MSVLLIFFGGAAILWYRKHRVAAILLIGLYYLIKSNIAAKYTDRLPYARQIDNWLEGK